MKKKSYFKLGLILILIPVLACSDDEPAAPVTAPVCSDPVTATVSTDPDVTFSWSPDCRLMGWLIEPANSGSDVWLVLHEGSNSIEPPITYGVVPAGAREIQEAQDLIPGMEYKLILWKWTGPGDQDGIPIETVNFTR